MEQLVKAGKDLIQAEKVAIILHGRGGNASGMKGLIEVLSFPDFAFLIPQAPGNTWYPYGFMAEESENEPYLSQSLEQIHSLVQGLKEDGKDLSNLYFIGFSQGACLALEYIARYPARYGGACAFTGGLIGKSVSAEKYPGDLKGTPVFIGASEKDFHVPMARIQASGSILSGMQADVKILGFPDGMHTIREEEIAAANDFIFKKTP
ncbi:alpha/beta hydrolase [Cyclobacterium jeungdonense]|uniref:Dienelactone hydrolase family protein n=1 Tax=Cyclobacterium jeungdonense TaxID=708087 RepID=A0ABT8C5F3_9BACT|nr:dienelactone hydrolase family protein [Cyclobacterium jeungdonense]MDN3686955.1 dienelactone hydrolase family protein [Cyclobacterium jeungdonense]